MKKFGIISKQHKKTLISSREVIHINGKTIKDPTQSLPIDVIYFDFWKAFDTVPHSRLLLKLVAYGISGNVLNWIKSFLVHRKQHVVINEEFSPCTWSTVKSRVPMYFSLCF